MKITKAEKKLCKDIICKCAAVIGCTPVNLAELTKMTMALAKVFNVPMTEALANTTAVNALKNVEEELAKLPFVSGLITGLMKPLMFPFCFIPMVIDPTAYKRVEMAGWQIAEDFANQRS